MKEEKKDKVLPAAIPLALQQADGPCILLYRIITELYLGCGFAICLCQGIPSHRLGLHQFIASFSSLVNQQTYLKLCYKCRINHI